MKAEYLKLLAEAMGHQACVVKGGFVEIKKTDSGGGDWWDLFEPHIDPAQFVEVMEWMLQNSKNEEPKIHSFMPNHNFQNHRYRVMANGITDSSSKVYDTLMEAGTFAAIELAESLKNG